jgi:hypothetical protein
MPLSTFLDGTTPSQLRGLQWLSLSDYGRVGSGTVISDGGGGGTTTWAEGGTVACRVDPLGGGVGRSTGGQIDERSTHQVTVPPGVVGSAIGWLGLRSPATCDRFSEPI